MGSCSWQTIIQFLRDAHMAEANSLHQLANHVSEPLWKWMVNAQRGLHMATAPVNKWLNLRKNPQPELPSQDIPEFLTNKNNKGCEI